MAKQDVSRSSGERVAAAPEALRVDEIAVLAREVIAAHPNGVRYSEIVAELRRQTQPAQHNTVNTVVAKISSHYPEVERPSRGLYRLKSAEPPEGLGALAAPVEAAEAKREVTFYPALVDYLKNEREEVTKACELGGASIGGKWGTPDVLGVYAPGPRDVFKFEAELVSAEVKIDPKQPIVAFGQAVSYRLFSHRVWIALPTSISPEDKGRIEALAVLFGIGLVLFDPEAETTTFELCVAAQRHTPDPFYLNEFASQLEKGSPEVFTSLFA